MCQLKALIFLPRFWNSGISLFFFSSILDHGSLLAVYLEKEKLHNHSKGLSYLQTNSLGFQIYNITT
jgi:hypothetical protein